ncbi:MAG: triple tyrosine motif-containing protein [Bacteroidales bacterium]
MPGIKFKVFILFIFFISIALKTDINGQIKSIGIPFIQNYKKTQYNAATQNWAIMQDKRGIMYFGNNEGVLEFDGNNWNLFPIPNHSIVRSLAVDEKGTIWVGADNEFGYLATDNQGKRYYQSLNSKFPDRYREFGAVWKIYPTKNGIYIQSMVTVFYYDFEEITVIENYGDYQFSFFVDNRFFIQKRHEGLFELRGNKFYKINGGEVFRDKTEVWAMLPVGRDSILIATQQQGLFMYDGYIVKKFNTPVENTLIKNQVFSVIKLKNGHFAFGTIQNGLYITDNKGRIKQHIDNSKGLQNNTILSIFEDMDNQLWLGLDNGIDYIEIRSPFTVINQSYGVFGTGYTAKLFNNQLYLGTNQGLYSSDWAKVSGEFSSNVNFIPVENSNGQVWKLENMDNHLLCGHDRGTFEIVSNKAVQIATEKGGWNYLFPLGRNDLIIGGTYACITLYKRSSSNSWQFMYRIKGLHDSSRDIVFDENGKYWMSHGLKGIFSFRMNETLDSIQNLKLYTSKDGLPSSFENFTYKINNDVIVCAEKGIYQYNETTDKFEPSAKYNSIFGSENKIRTPKTDKNGNIWFYKNNHPCLLKKEKVGFKLVESIFRKFEKTAINSFENIEILNDSNILFGTDQGFIHYNPLINDTAQIKFKTLIRNVKVTRNTDSVIYSGNDDSLENSYSVQITLPFRLNALKFSFVAPYYSDIHRNQYRYKLIGFDNDWSDWQAINEKEYTNLPPGDYIFIVQSVNIAGQNGDIAEFKFTILPPWYNTAWAYLVYFSLILIIIVLTSRYLIYRIKKERTIYQLKQHQRLKQKEEEFAKDSLLKEQKIIKLKNEMLEAEVAIKRGEMELKNRELASIAFQITHKNEILSNLKYTIDQLTNKVNEQTQKELKQLIKTIDADLKLDQDWELFTKHFEDVHSDFFTRLKSNHPDLTPKDLKLCAYLRMNLSTKEIAPLMNISVRGVEISRYRLRKKLDLEKDANLIDYMLNI